MRTDRAYLRLRLTPALKDWLRKQAKLNGRTMNAEITFRLEIARMGIQPVLVRQQPEGATAAG